MEMEHEALVALCDFMFLSLHRIHIKHLRLPHRMVFESWVYCCIALYVGA